MVKWGILDMFGTMNNRIISSGIMVGPSGQVGNTRYVWYYE